MIQKLLQKIRSRTSKITNKHFQKLKNSNQGLKQDQTREEEEYQQALNQSKSLFRNFLFKEPVQLTLLRKCVQQERCPEEVLEFSEQAIWELYCKNDYSNVINCVEVVLPYVEREFSKDNMSIGHISLIMAESCQKQGDYVRTIMYLNEAEDSFFLNEEKLSEYETFMKYYYSLKIGQLYSKLNMIDKSFFYAALCLNTQKLSFLQKLPPCKLILNYYVTKNDLKEATDFGNAILKQLSFKNLLQKCKPQEVESVCEIYKIMIDLEKNQQSQYVLIDQFLLLLYLTKSNDQSLLEMLNKKKIKIQEDLNNQKDLLYVLAFYGKKMKLETSPELKQQQK
ncbi:hypothetical protein ABPG72_019191 [Tetrahymena utriculariae]